MRPPHSPDIELVCTGTIVHFGECRCSTVTVAQTPGEVREIMRSSKNPLIELCHHGDREIPVYVDQYKIIALVPWWTKVEED